MSVTATVYDDLRRTDFDMVADWQELGNAQDGGPFLKAAVTVNAENPVATFEIPWGSIERPTNGREVPAQKWIDLAGTERVVTAASRDPRAIDVSRYFNEDVIATPEAPADGDFDAGDRAYSAEILPAGDSPTIAADGIPFYRLPVDAGALNCIRAEGQTIEWPAEPCDALAVLGASSNGRHGGTAKLLYADGATQAIPLQLSDWCAAPALGELSAFTVDYRFEAGQRSGPANHIWLKRLTVGADKALRGIVLPSDSDLHIFGLAFSEAVQFRPVWGMSLLNDCKYGFDVKDNTMRMSLLRASYNPDPTPDVGTHRIRWALYPHSGDWRSAQTPRRAMELNNPPIVRLVPAHAGPLPPQYSFVRVEPAEMILSAFKRAEDGDAYVARVYNSCGEGGQARIRCNLPFKEAVACDLLEVERAENSASVEGPLVTLDLEGRLHGTVRLER